MAAQFTALVTRWQHHAAAVGVFLVWGELMLMVGRLPTFGTRLTPCHCSCTKLETKVSKDFTITEKAPTRRESAKHLRIYYDTMLNRHLIKQDK